MMGAGPIEHAAREVARENASDEEARDRLRARITDEQAARTAAEMLARLRDSYINDRAYRLLTAALDQTEVRQIDAAVREDFLREEALGRMPLEEAFEHLAQLEPGLTELVAEEVDSSQASRDQQSFKRITVQTHGLVGIAARSGDPLMRSDIAASIVKQYVGIRSGRLRGDLRAPYFDKRITSSYSGNFIGGVDRPRATN
jgi:hypothetical protein